MHEKNETIRKLKLSIANIEQETDLSNRKLISDAQKVELAEIRNSEGKKSKLQQEVIQLKQRLQTQVSSHRDGEMTLRKVGCWLIFPSLFSILYEFSCNLSLKVVYLLLKG